jgi:4'-phosphopantetheinyl transferase
LSPDEVSRVAKFVDKKAMSHFVLGRSALRWILGEHLQADPRQPQFRYGDYGKPELSSSALHFSVSHSGDLVVTAVAGGAIGVNVEILRRFGYEESVSEHFAACERRDIAALESEARRFAFFRYWTAKEAVTKALGYGLAIPLNAIEVSFTPCANASALIALRAGALRGRWYAYELELGQECRGMVVAESSEMRVSLRQLSAWRGLLH